MNLSLNILSCGTGNLAETLTPRLRLLIEQADVLFGSRTLLAQIPFPYAGTKVVIGAAARLDAQHALELYRAGKRVVVLASGDALYHGFGGTLARLLQQDSLEQETLGKDAPENTSGGVSYHPNVTAFQTLFHRLGLPWDDARLFSAHSAPQDTGFSLREIVEAPLAVVYGGSHTPAHELARRILAFHPESATRTAIMAENLNNLDKAFSCTSDEQSASPDNQRTGERILRGNLAELASIPVGPTSMLVLLPAPDVPSLPLALGLPETDYERENNLITPSDIRAVVLARLRLPVTGVLWDIGAGSGSVGLEAAALRPRLQVFGVEKHPDRIAMIERNRLRLGVGNYVVLRADAAHLAHLAHLTDLPNLPNLSNLVDRTDLVDLVLLTEPHPTTATPLPRPDRIFVGGGGEHLPVILDACYAALKPGGILLASAVTLETLHRLYAWNPAYRTDLSALDIAREQPLAGRYHQLKPQNRITLFTFCKPRDES